MTTLDPSHARIHGVAAGWALTAVLMIVLLICALAAFLWPTSAFGQGWAAVFATTPDGSIAGVIEILLGVVVLAWLITGVFVGVYNCLLARARG
jgi:hypothetical protein